MIIVLFGIKHFFGGLFVEGGVYNPYVFLLAGNAKIILII